MRHHGCLALAICALGCSSSPAGGSDMTTCDRGLPPYGVVTDERYVYWGSVDGTIWRAAHPGSERQVLARLPDPAMTGLFLRGMELDTQALYVAAGDGDIWRVPLDGAPPAVLAHSLAWAHDVAVTADYVYFTSYEHLSRVPIGGGETTLLVPAPPEGHGCAASAVASSTDVYFTDPCAGALFELPLSGGAVTTVDAAPMLTYGGSHDVVTIADGYVYWQRFDATIKRLPIAGGATTTVTTTTASSYVHGLAVDADAVYWIESESYPSTAIVRRAPLAGGAAETLATLAHEGALALGPAVVYVADGSDCLTVVPR